MFRFGAVPRIFFYKVSTDDFNGPCGSNSAALSFFGFQIKTDLSSILVFPGSRDPWVCSLTFSTWAFAVNVCTDVDCCVMMILVCDHLCPKYSQSKLLKLYVLQLRQGKREPCTVESQCLVGLICKQHRFGLQNPYHLKVRKGSHFCPYTSTYHSRFRQGKWLQRHSLREMRISAGSSTSISCSLCQAGTFWSGFGEVPLISHCCCSLSLSSFDPFPWLSEFLGHHSFLYPSLIATPAPPLPMVSLLFYN